MVEYRKRLLKELVVVDQKPLDHLRCVVERITYQSDGYSVLKCAAKGYNDLIAVVGLMLDHDLPARA